MNSLVMLDINGPIAKFCQPGYAVTLLVGATGLKTAIFCSKSLVKGSVSEEYTVNLYERTNKRNINACDNGYPSPDNTRCILRNSLEYNNLSQQIDPLNPNCLWGIRERGNVYCMKCKPGFVSVNGGATAISRADQCIQQTE